MQAVVAIPPGTHHVRFFVDGVMTTSPNLPTAVDDTGILVNYLEVSADDMPSLNRQITPGGSVAHPGNHRAPDSSDRVPPINTPCSLATLPKAQPTPSCGLNGKSNHSLEVSCSSIKFATASA